MEGVVVMVLQPAMAPAMAPAMVLEVVAAAVVAVTLSQDRGGAKCASPSWALRKWGRLRIS